MKIQRFLSFWGILLVLPLMGWAQSPQLADSLFQKGKEYDKSGKMEESELYYRKAYNLYRDVQDTASWLEAGKEYGSAMVYGSKYDEAMELYKKLLDVNHPANDVYNRGDLYNSMGWASNSMGKPDQALTYYEQSLPLAEESGDSLLIGVVYDNLGGAYDRKGNYRQALKYSQKALPYFEGLGYKRSISITLANIGSLYEDLNLYDQALNYYNRSLEIREQLDNVQLLSNIYNHFGSLYSSLGEYDQALVNYQKSLEYSRKAGIPSELSSRLNNIGLLYKRVGEYERARDYYEQSLAVKEDLSNPLSIATTTKNIGKLLWEQGKIEEAKPYYEKALALRKEHGNVYDIASSLTTMVDVAIEEQNFDEAQKYTEQIRAIGDSTDSYDFLGKAAMYSGRIDAAQDKDEQALRHFKTEYEYSQNLPEIKQLSPLKHLAKQYNKMNSDSALVCGQKAIDIIEKYRTSAGATSDLRAGYFGTHSDFYTQMASWTLHYTQDLSRAFTLMEQGKARSLSDELARAAQNIDQQLPEEVRIERREKRQSIDSLYTELESTRDEEAQSKIQAQIRSAELDYEAFENNLRREYPELKNLQYPDPVSLARARQATDAQTAVLEYAVAEDELIIFLISQNDVRAEQFSLSDDLPLDEQLTSWVSDFKSAILSNAPRAQLRSQSAKLYDSLIKPFEEQLDQFSNLIVVPDGALAYLPFEALSRGNQYLIEDFNIKYVPSMTSLDLLDQSETTNRQELLAVAGSDFSEENNSESVLRQKKLSTLPSTVMEVDSISARFQQSTVLKDEEVSEERFKEMVQKNSYRYIHMATHGIIDEEYPHRSGLALSTKNEITRTSREDGLLRSSEILGLNINSDMVVLSACNTGLGKVVKGEGMLGMQRSFFYAGTSTVVVSLWNVYDRSTATMMTEFYEALKKSENEESWTESLLHWIGWDQSIPFGQKATAMREAKLKMIKHPLFNHPVYWAPFIVVGG